MKIHDSLLVLSLLYIFELRQILLHASSSILHALYMSFINFLSQNLSNRYLYACAYLSISALLVHNIVSTIFRTDKQYIAMTIRIFCIIAWLTNQKYENMLHQSKSIRRIRFRTFCSNADSDSIGYIFTI